jgi:hypothetical protein
MSNCWLNRYVYLPISRACRPRTENPAGVSVSDDIVKWFGKLLQIRFVCTSGGGFFLIIACL